jgi:hypothetical protein
VFQKAVNLIKWRVEPYCFPLNLCLQERFAWRAVSCAVAVRAIIITGTIQCELNAQRGSNISNNAGSNTAISVTSQSKRTSTLS